MSNAPFHAASSFKLERPPLIKKEEALLPIYSITPFTMLDFPDKTSCIIWFSGCNMRCGYCHNPQIVKSKGRYPIEDVLSFLKRRKGLLEGVVLSGGEACLYPDIIDFAKIIKSFGYALKIDTNGTKPGIIENLLTESLVDYVALDYKSPPEKFKKVTGIDRFNLFDKTLNLLCTQKKINFEVRTTVHTDLMNEEDVSLIMQDLDKRGYGGMYYIQNYICDNDRPTLGNIFPQKRVLDASILYQPQNYKVELRNF